MAITNEDLAKIREVIAAELSGIKSDLKTIKTDVGILASLNQLDEIKKNARLMRLHKADDEQEA